MINTQVTLLAFPKQYCQVDNLDLSVLMDRALRIEKKMKTGVKLADEQRRYQLYCDRLEYYGTWLSEQSEVLVCDLGNGYLELLLEISQKYPEEYSKSRLGANFCPNNYLTQAIQDLIAIQKLMGWQNNPVWQAKIDFYRRALANDLHILEVQIFASDDQVASAHDNFDDVLSSLKVRDDITLAEDNAFVALERQFDLVLEHKEQGIPDAVNFSDLGHHVITEVLWQMLYRRGKPTYVPVVYADGSVAAPFPVQCLKPRSPQDISSIQHAPLLPIGMMSQRHTELDPKVKMYWFRNQELSTGQRAAEIDELAYRQSKAAFAQMRQESIYRIAFYQTGFQPVVVGFYRALAEELIAYRSKPPRLEVIPHYFLHEEYREGKHWV